MGNGIFSKFAQAKTYESGNYFEPGEYEADILEYFLNDGHKGQRGIAELIVVSSQQTEHDKKPAPVNAKRSVVFVLDGTHKDVGQGKLKSFTLACVVPADEKPSDDEIAETMEDILGDAMRTNNVKNKGETQKLRGKRLRITASTASKATKNGVICTNLKFKFVEQSAEVIAKRRAELDAAGF
jgi:hypothetical protein